MEQTTEKKYRLLCSTHVPAWEYFYIVCSTIGNPAKARRTIVVKTVTALSGKVERPVWCVCMTCLGGETGARSARDCRNTGMLGASSWIC